MTYAEKLKDPRWQKKRLEILDRDGWKCAICGDGSSTLSVHHRHYFYGNEPWEYSNSYLTSLCQNCHETEEYYRGENSDFLPVLRSTGWTDCEINRLLNAIAGKDKEDILKKVGASL